MEQRLNITSCHPGRGGDTWCGFYIHHFAEAEDMRKLVIEGKRSLEVKHIMLVDNGAFLGILR